MSAISLDNARMMFRTTTGLLRRQTKETLALDGVSLEIAEGELYGLLGPNGAGKTTAVKVLTTLLIPTSGRASVLGLDVVKDASAVRRKIGFVLGGERGLYWRLSGRDNLRYFAELPARDLAGAWLALLVTSAAFLGASFWLYRLALERARRLGRLAWV